MKPDAILVLDIGKTNVKLALLDAAGGAIAERRMPNAACHDGLYPHHDTDAIWAWMLAAITDFACLAQIGAIVPVTHGATAALVDGCGLVLPILDYESSLPQATNPHYQNERPAYAKSLSPDLPAGLNLGRQLAWLEQSFPDQFSSATHVLLYPQYWAWRLCGIAAAEVTSLGCHTDLWEPAAGDYSGLALRRGWDKLFPPLRNAWDTLGHVLPELAKATGLPASCRVVTGIHDSNASLLRYLNTPTGAVLSTGTWVIAASFGTALDTLQESADMLANVNALGQPVACMRFMGGREFAALAGPAPVACTLQDIARLVERGTRALPCFADGGPFYGAHGSIEGPLLATAEERYALATLYCALMSDYCVEVLDAGGTLVIEGSLAGNAHFAALLAALRPGQSVTVSHDTSGTTQGGWLLANWGGVAAQPPLPAVPAQLPGLSQYRQQWRTRVAQLACHGRADTCYRE